MNIRTEAIEKGKEIKKQIEELFNKEEDGNKKLIGEIIKKNKDESKKENYIVSKNIEKLN